ncbi:pyruvate dehydrogenase E1 component subunit alpha, mitochondrial [Nilaparvata lugens]|uniref:pyruvate dehydrogenase E1 component subunit alpha, mitochondrial n=1 Tax=Nilaparvata lugens TaxID=108931 RepID=UPI000B9902DD|nr:pyruvate dehydrogenase E1 component subunit alpha, mitochondrial [Nilaparvata lugens]
MSVLLRGLQSKVNKTNFACFLRRGKYSCDTPKNPNDPTQGRSASTEAEFNVKPCDLHRLDKGPAQKVKISSDEVLKLYREMQAIRRIEMASSALYKEKLILGFCHLYSGQEAVCVGMKSIMRPQDSIVASYRIHGWAYSFGVSALGILSEQTGRHSGICRGKGGSMHMYEKNFFGGNGIVGAQVPLAAGVAFANKYKGNDGICYGLYGDGAANNGQVFEAFNMAALWALPVCFVCENNLYGMGTSVNRSSASTDYFKRGDFIPGIRVDGMDILAVRAATQFVTEYCTAGKGPLMMEMLTYRYMGHSMSDPGTTYRTREEVAEMRKSRDPILMLRERAMDANLVTEQQFKAIDKEVKKEVDEATQKAKTDSFLPEEEIANDVYVNSLETEIRGNTIFNNYKHRNTRNPINL